MRILKPLPGILPMPGRPLADAVGLWPMNSLGNKVFDLSGNGNTGTFNATNSPVWTSGKFGSALAFTSDFIDLGKPPSIKQASQSGLTVMYAISVASISSYDCVVCGGYPNLSWAMMHNSNTTYPRAYAFNRAVTCPIDYGTGYYIFAFTATAARFDWYKNGIWVGESVGAGTWEMDSQNAAIGAVWDGATHSYRLSDSILHWVSLYNRILSASEIALLYREPFCMFPENIMPEFGIAT